MDFDLSAGQWAIAILAALAVGVSKTGFGGIGLLAVSLMVDLFDKASVGVLLPMLILADISVYPLFRKHASWGPVWKLLPTTLLGCVVGYFALREMPDDWARPVIGGIILVMVGLQIFRRYGKETFDRIAHSRTAGAAAGCSAGVATMIANAAGPVFQLFLISRRFKKMELIGVGARFFLLINILKVPFLSGLSFINGESLIFNAKLAPVILIGVVLGKWLVHAISQRVFEAMVIIFAALAGLRLVIA